MQKVINTSHVFAAEVDLKYEVILRNMSARLASITIELISPSASSAPVNLQDWQAWQPDYRTALGKLHPRFISFGVLIFLWLLFAFCPFVLVFVSALWDVGRIFSIIAMACFLRKNSLISRVLMERFYLLQLLSLLQLFGVKKEGYLSLGVRFVFSNELL